MLKTKIKKRLGQLATDKSGFSNLIGLLLAFLLILVVISITIGVYGQLHTISVLDHFKDEMGAVVSLEGKCSGTAINERYEALCKSAGIRPTVTYETSFYNYNKKTVQYGDEITVTVTYQSKLIGWGDVAVTLPLKVKTTVQSMQYWKG